MVTVIIPTYKRTDYIERAINSILNQTYKDFEIIVVDDNNPDTEDRKELEKIIEKYKENNKVIYIQHDKNKNGAAARNTGIKIAKGEYITFLDDDDYFLSNRLEVLVSALETNNDYDAVYSSCIYVRNKNIVKEIKANFSGKFIKELLMQKSFFGTGSNLFFRSKALKEIDGFDETYIRHQDIELMLRFFESNKSILGIDEILVVKTEDSRINIPKTEKFLQIKEKFLCDFKYIIDRYTESEKNKIYYENYLQILYGSVRNKEYKYYKKIKNIVNKYGKLTFKQINKIIILFISNYIDYRSILDRIKYNFRYKKRLKDYND